ncbi:MAG: hypothetical protein K8S94_17680 [Planctomycetia bacterium]|nr:hypothetical protein [Planctomycetia bacterium]
MNTTPDPLHDSPAPDRLDHLRRTCADAGPEVMLDALAASLAEQRRWHALFDARLMQARVAVGLSPVGSPGDIPAAVRDRFDERSLAACREVGWPLLDEGQVAAAWMYLRAATDPVEVSAKLEPLALAAAADENDEESSRKLQEILGIALWEGVDPALGISLVLRTQGTCNAITTYEQAVSRLPATRQRPAAGVLVAHLHAEVSANLVRDLEHRGCSLPALPASIPALLAAAGDGPAGLYADVSHVQSVLRIARLCDDEPTIRRAWELATYASRLPADVVYPGEPPFENVGEASRLFYGSQLGIDADKAVRFFRTAAATAEPGAGALPCDTLVLLLTRLKRPAEALHAAIARPRDDGMPSPLQAAGALPSLVDLAAESGEWELLRRASSDRGDEITFAASLIAEYQKNQGNRGPQV